jgi:putative endonuclease
MPRTPTKFFYVYVLVSEIDPKRRYTARICDLQQRLHKHNRGECSHTSKYTPWKIETAVAFRSEAKAQRIGTFCEKDGCFWKATIAARAGRQCSFVESFRDEAQLNRGLSHASTTGQ